MRLFLRAGDRERQPLVGRSQVGAEDFKLSRPHLRFQVKGVYALFCYQ